MGADGPITPVLAGAMCCYFNAVRVVDGIGNLRTPRLQSEAEPQKTMRLPIEFGLYPNFGHFEPVWAYRPGVYINYPRSFAVGCMGIVRLSVATPRVDSLATSLFELEQTYQPGYNIRSVPCIPQHTVAQIC